MASKSRNRNRGRDAYPVANRPALHSVSRSIFSPEIALTQIEDRRSWHPEGDYRPALNTRTRPNRLIVAEPKKTAAKIKRPSIYSFSSKIGFKAPGNVLICIRRKARKEVLHALKKTGRGPGRKPRRNWYSNIRC